jgi:hypothetical protein
MPDNNFAAYKAEMVRWKCKWQNVTEKPSTLIDTLKHAKPELYSNIHRAVKVLFTMHVTSTTAERSFSALKRIKTYLRSTIVEDRLNGVSLMHVHPDIPLNFDQAISTFAADGNRRTQLIFPYYTHINMQWPGYTSLVVGAVLPIFVAILCLFHYFCC